MISSRLGMQRKFARYLYGKRINWLIRFYNTTYTVFAASIILLYIEKCSAGPEEVRSLFKFVNMAVEILEIMDECVVALEAARLLRRATEKAESRLSSENASTDCEEPTDHGALDSDPIASLFTDFEDNSLRLNQYWGPLTLGLIDGTGMDFNISTQPGAFEPSNLMFLPLGS